MTFCLSQETIVEEIQILQCVSHLKFYSFSNKTKFIYVIFQLQFLYRSISTSFSEFCSSFPSLSSLLPSSPYPLLLRPGHCKKVNVMILLFLCFSRFNLQRHWTRGPIHGLEFWRSQRWNLANTTQSYSSPMNEVISEPLDSSTLIRRCVYQIILCQF